MKGMNHLFRISIVILLLASSFGAKAQKNQNDQIIGRLKDDSYAVYKAVKKGSKTSLEKATKPWPVQYFEGNDGIEKILVKRVGLIDEYYDVDLPKFPGYFQNSSSGICLTAIDNKLFYYNYSSKSGATIKYILTLEGNVKKFEEEKAELESYRKSIKSLQQGARTERKEAKAEEAKILAAENSLKGKNIKSIKVKLVNSPTEFGMLSVFQLGIEVTLTNGKVLKTKNLGGLTPYTDFDYKTTSGEYEGGSFKIYGSSNKIQNDRLTVSVWSKYNPTIKGHFEHALNYRNDLFYNLQGKWGQNGRRVVGYSDYGTNGTSGHNLTVTANSRKTNNNTVIDVSISDNNTGATYQCTIHQENTLNLDVRGGKGGDGLNGDRTSSGNGANGGNGGNGGTIIIRGNASKILKVEAKTSGGAGGKGGAAKSLAYRSGTNGSNGTSGKLIRN